MKTTAGILWRARAVLPSGSEELLVEVLAGRFGGAVTSYSDFETGLTTIDVFLKSRLDWTEGTRELSGFWRAPGGNAPVFRLTRVRKRDWAESWKRHFKPLRIGKGLVVRPPWERVPAGKDVKVVVLEPGLSFGTGHHATTSFCLREIVRYSSKGEERSFLDIGTGSGILAIAAAKLGYRPVRAFDFDPECVRVSRANAVRNRVSAAVEIGPGDVSRLPLRLRPGRGYDLVCANLISNLLMAHRDRILASVKPGGVVVLAGILAAEFERVQRCYESAWVRLVRSRSEKEWRSGSFEKPLVK